MQGENLCSVGGERQRSTHEYKGQSAFRASRRKAGFGAQTSDDVHLGAITAGSSGKSTEIKVGAGAM